MIKFLKHLFLRKKEPPSERVPVIIPYTCEDYLTKFKILLLDSNLTQNVDINQYTEIFNKLESIEFDKSGFYYYCQIIYGFYNQLITPDNHLFHKKFNEINIKIINLSNIIFNNKLFIESIQNNYEFKKLLESFLQNEELADEPLFDLICEILTKTPANLIIELNVSYVNIIQFKKMTDVVINHFKFNYEVIIAAIFSALKQNQPEENINATIDILNKLKRFMIQYEKLLKKLATNTDEATFFKIYNHCTHNLNFTAQAIIYANLMVKPEYLQLINNHDPLTFESILEYKRTLSKEWMPEHLMGNGFTISGDSIKLILNNLNLPYNLNIYKVIIDYMCPKFIIFLKSVATINPTESNLESFLTNHKNDIEKVLFSQNEFEDIDLSSLTMFSKKKLLQLYINKDAETSSYYIRDLCFQHQILVNYNKDPGNLPLHIPNPNKAKSIKEYHDQLTLIASKIKSPKFNLNQENISFLMKYNSNPNKKFKIVIPKTNHDLIDIGTLLSICVGSAGYDRKVLDKQSNIIAIYSLSDKLLYCIELEYKSHKIIQAKALRNKEIPDYKYNIIKELIKDK